MGRGTILWLMCTRITNSPTRLQRKAGHLSPGSYPYCELPLRCWTVNTTKYWSTASQHIEDLQTEHVHTSSSTRTPTRPNSNLHSHHRICHAVQERAGPVQEKAQLGRPPISEKMPHFGVIDSTTIPSLQGYNVASQKTCSLGVKTESIA